MAPKAKAKVGPGALPKVKAKAKAKGAAKAKAKVKAAAKGRVRLRVRGRGVAALRRPAARQEEQRVPQLWDSGHTVRGGDLTVDVLLKEKQIVVEEGRYFHRECKVAGNVVTASRVDDQVTLRLRPTGTTDEALLKLQSGTPALELRLILCGAGCNHEETAEDLIHAVRIRKRRSDGAEEPWVDNLEKVSPLEKEDELLSLRALQKEHDRKKAQGAVQEAEKVEKRKKKEKEKEKKKKKRKKEKEAAKRKSTSSVSSSSGKPALDGTRAKAASQKTVKSLFQGTGLDPAERVRQKVARLAKRYVRKKGKPSSSDSGSSSGSSKGGRLEDEGDTVFQQAARVRGIAEAFPGVLAHQALNQMKSNLMQHLEEDDKGGACQPVAVQYYRQVLQRKAGGATARELLSLCAAADLLVRGRPAQALDLILQRVKSAESTLGGTHWTVSQKLEVLPAEQATITATSELKEAQKVAQEEAKMRWLATSPDTRFSPSQKGGGKGKPGKGGDGKKGGKNQNSKGDGKRKEEGAGKGT